MKSYKITLDFKDHTELLDLLRISAANMKQSQKALVVEALEGYFASQQENLVLAKAADAIFVEWNDPENDVYDTF